VGAAIKPKRGAATINTVPGRDELSTTVVLASASLSRIEEIVACREELTAILHQLKGSQPAHSLVEPALHFVSGRKRDFLFRECIGI
jgi:hypothetical protein